MGLVPSSKSEPATAAIGIDFGTTNSSIALANCSGEVKLARFTANSGVMESYRSLLYLEQIKTRGVNSTKSWTGPAGIERYLAAETKGRLIQSLKSFLSSRTLQKTNVFGRPAMLEELIARILGDLRAEAESQFGIDVRSAVVGRPVRFVGSKGDEDDQYAESRLRKAFRAAGFDSVEFEMEPVAAAYHYESTLDHKELILIGDFGGGTSDFSLIHVGPARTIAGHSENLLANGGVGIAGDSFDARIVRHLVSPALGAGTQMRSMNANKTLPVPIWVYSKLERWHHLSLLKSQETLEMLKSVQGLANEPAKIAGLVHLIREDLGYQLHRAVQDVKCNLSLKPSATFRFSDGFVDLEEEVKRADFETWIAPELDQIACCVDTLLATAGVKAEKVDMVFLTGGSSFVPAVRRIFETRFGEQRIRTGDEFTSVARGLALKALAQTPK